MSDIWDEENVTHIGWTRVRAINCYEQITQINQQPGSNWVELSLILD